jgi:hypothetical protein
LADVERERIALAEGQLVGRGLVVTPSLEAMRREDRQDPRHAWINV